MFLKSHFGKLGGFRLFALAALISAIGVAGSACADDYYAERTKQGFEVMSFKEGSSITRGMMIGFRSVRYLPQANYYWGYRIYAGSRYGGIVKDDHLAYGGLSLGLDGLVSKFFTYDLSILVGYGFAHVATHDISADGIAVQPTAAFGLAALAGWRATFSMGYLHLNSSSGSSGITFGIRLERKTSGNSTGSDN